MADEEHKALSAIAESHRLRVDKANTIDEIVEVIASAKSQAGDGDWSYIVYPSIFTWAMAKAYSIAPNSDMTSELEREWVVAFAKFGFPISDAHIEEKRAEANYWNVLRPMVLRHNKLCKEAVSPSDLMSIVSDVTEDIPPEMDSRFREAALGQAYEAAWLLDPDDKQTIAIGEELDSHAGRGVAHMIAEESARKARKKRS